MRVWITRDEPPDGPLTTAVRDAGLDPVHEPVLDRRVVDDARAAIARLGPDDWLVLTSPYAVRAVPADVARVPRVAVVGEPSRRAAETLGFRVEMVSDDGTGAGLFRQLATRAAGTTVLYPRSSLAKVPDLPEGITLISPVLYETVTRSYRRDVIDEVDVIAVASPSAVRAVLDTTPTDRPFASIGPTTSRALRGAGIEPWVEAPEPSFPALAQAIALSGPS